MSFSARFNFFKHITGAKIVSAKITIFLNVDNIQIPLYLEKQAKNNILKMLNIHELAISYMNIYYEEWKERILEAQFLKVEYRFDTFGLSAHLSNYSMAR